MDGGTQMIPMLPETNRWAKAAALMHQVVSYQKEAWDGCSESRMHQLTTGTDSCRELVANGQGWKVRFEKWDLSFWYMQIFLDK